MNPKLEQGDHIQPANVPNSPIDVASFQSALRQVLSDAGDDPHESAAVALRFLLDVPGAHAAAYFCEAESQRLRPASSLICHNEFADRIRGHQPQLIEAVDHMLRRGEPMAYPLPGQDFDLFVLPVRSGDKIAAAIALFATAEAVETSVCLQAAQLVAVELSAPSALQDSTELVGDATGAGGEPTPALVLPPASSLSLPDTNQATIEQLLAETLFAADQRDSTRTLCGRIAACLEGSLGVSQVMLGIADRRGRRCKLQAISGMSSFEEHAPLVKLIDELMAESVLHDAIFDVRSSDSAHQKTAAEQAVLTAIDADRLCHGPLVDGSGQKVGAFVVVDHPDSHRSGDLVDLMTAVCHVQPALAGALGLVGKMGPDRMSLLMRRLRLSGDHPQHRRRVWAVTVVTLALLMTPMPYRVTCESEIFPVMHRFVPAPFEGVLKEVLVKPGDVVAEGQVLAQMDERELKWQFAANRADYMQASKKYDTSLANRDTSAAQMARLEMERLDAETKRLKNRKRKLDITSPISGIILGGESDKLEGARIRVGENLFETGPLERMVAEVYVPDAEIARVQAGQQVRVRLDAFPFRTFRGQVASLSPRAETRKDQNVFVADVELDNVKNLLRPGMVGQGRVSTGWYPLGWNLFHKPFYQLLKLVRW